MIFVAIIIAASIGFAFPTWYGYSFAKSAEDLVNKQITGQAEDLKIPLFVDEGIFMPANVSSIPVSLGKLVFIRAASNEGTNSLTLVFSNAEFTINSSSLTSYLPNQHTDSSFPVEKNSVMLDVQQQGVLSSMKWTGILLGWAENATLGNVLSMYGQGPDDQTFRPVAELLGSNVAGHNGTFVYKDPGCSSGLKCEEGYVNGEFKILTQGGIDYKTYSMSRLAKITVNTGEDGGQWVDFAFQSGGTGRVRFRQTNAT